MKLNFIRSSFLAILLMTGGVSSMGSSAWAASIPDRDPDREAIMSVIGMYSQSINLADTKLASSIWVTTDEASFIHPRGHEQGWEAVKDNFYGKTMGDRFSERDLIVRDITIHVYGNSAVVEFYWDFYAKFRDDGSPKHTQGRESQVYIKDNHQWKIVHVHYSNMPVTGEREGF